MRFCWGLIAQAIPLCLAYTPIWTCDGLMQKATWSHSLCAWKLSADRVDWFGPHLCPPLFTWTFLSHVSSLLCKTPRIVLHVVRCTALLIIDKLCTWVDVWLLIRVLWCFFLDVVSNSAIVIIVLFFLFLVFNVSLLLFFLVLVMLLQAFAFRGVMRTLLVLLLFLSLMIDVLEQL